MKVIGYRNSYDKTQRPGQQFIHIAVLECGHTVRVGHGDIRENIPCPTCEPPPAKPVQKRVA